MKKQKLNTKNFLQSHFTVTKDHSLYESYVRAPKLGETIKAIRIESRQTQEQMAKTLKISRQHLQKWEYNDVRPRPKTLYRFLEKYFDEDFELLFSKIIEYSYVYHTYYNLIN